MGGLKLGKGVAARQGSPGGVDCTEAWVSRRALLWVWGRPVGTAGGDVVLPQPCPAGRCARWRLKAEGAPRLSCRAQGSEVL